MDKDKEPDCYVFHEKGKTGYITVSRHLRPDFVAELSDEEIDKMYERIPVWFEHNE